MPGSDPDAAWRTPYPGDSRPQTDSENENGFNLSLTADQKRLRFGRRQTICGMRRNVFFIVLGVGLLVAIAAIGTGVGAGLAFSKKDKAAESH